MVAPDTRRRRDPERRERILTAAAQLAAGRGFHTVGLADIGAQAGIVGSGLYRHFASKDALLVALLDRGMDRLAEGAAAILATVPDGHAALSALLRDHIAVAIEERAVLAVYHREIYTLPEGPAGTYARTTPALVMNGHWGLGLTITPKTGAPVDVLILDHASG